MEPDPVKTAIDTLVEIARNNSDWLNRDRAIAILREYADLLNKDQRKEAEELWKQSLWERYNNASHPFQQVDAARAMLKAYSDGGGFDQSPMALSAPLRS